MKQVVVVVGVVQRADEVLIGKRKEDGSTFSNLWEFPGGKVELGEDLEDCLHRELAEELTISVCSVVKLVTIEHTYPRAHVTLHAYACRLHSGEPQPLVHQELRWVRIKALADYPFPPANATLLGRICSLLRDAGQFDEEGIDSKSAVR